MKRMKNAYSKWTVCVSLLCMFVFYNNCAQTQQPGFILKGTESGNPTMTTTSVLYALCGVINRCHPEVSLQECREGVLATSGIDYQLGLPIGSYNSFGAMLAAEQTGALTGDGTAADACYSGINAQECDDLAVVRAYDSTQSNPFSGVAGLIPTSDTKSCPAIFKPPTEVKAFPTAEGFGAQAAGGRGGRVIHVTNLNDSGPGSLRDALEATGPRIVVFDVSGTINLSSNINIEGASRSYLTVAGQTSPGGVQIKNHGIWIKYGAHDIVIRHLRVRPGSASDGTGDSIGIGVYTTAADPVSNVVLDHCSVQWAGDGLAVVYQTNGLSIQWSLLAEPRVNASSGSAVGLLYATASFHHNILAHVADNSPVVKGQTVDFRNNVIYNWSYNNGMKWGYFLENASAFGNSVNNHYIAGADSLAGDYLAVSNGGPTRIDSTSATGGGTKLYTEGTWGPNCPSGCADDWANGVDTLDYYYMSGGAMQPALPSQYRALVPFAAPPVNTDPTSAIKAKLVAAVGATKPSRDSTDARILNDVTNGTGAITNIGTGGPWPALSGGSAPVDTDGDGMPDSWESSHGLNPNDDTDGARVASNGYTNVENYLNELAGDAIP